MNYGEPKGCEVPLHEQIRQERAALCGMVPLITARDRRSGCAEVRDHRRIGQRCAEVAVTSQADYDRLLESYHVANRLARELKVALDAARQETADLATRCADLENDNVELRELHARDGVSLATLRTERDHWRSGFKDAHNRANEGRDRLVKAEVERDHWRNCHESLMAEYQSKLPPGILPDAYEAKQLRPHSSDCAVHNGPAYPAGPCSCGAYEPEPEQRLPAIPAAAASQGTPDPAKPAPALPLNALLHGPKATLR